MSLGENGQNTDDVFARVRDAILDGELAPGAVMSQVALAEELGISRTPLREALRMLQSERLVEAEPNRRVRVAPMSAADLEELCIARIALETEAMRLSVARLTPENVARLDGYMAEMAHYAGAKNYRRWTVPHRNFHRALTAPAGGRINDLLGQLFDHAERYRRLHIGHGPTPWATAGHRQILDACEAGDRDRSASLLASHLARTGSRWSSCSSPSTSRSRCAPRCSTWVARCRRGDRRAGPSAERPDGFRVHLGECGAVDCSAARRSRSLG